MTTTLRLKKNEDRRIKAGHLWVYSNEVDVQKTPLTDFSPGAEVILEANNGKILGIAYINPHSLIAARLLSRNPREKINEDFFVSRLQQALALRNMLFDKLFYRLVFAEGDFLPGLIIDRYNDNFVLQLNTAGMENNKEIIISALQKVVPVNAILLRNNSSMRELEKLPNYTEVSLGTLPELCEVQENNGSFFTSLQHGQKTGWFYDHRDNRAHLLPFVKGKHVLDVFSYVGAWGISAAIAGADAVTCIDSSQAALDILRKNAKHNQVSEKVSSIKADAFAILQQLQTANEKFDVIILDPPALIKRRKDISAGARAYQQLNELALSLLNPNGLLASASCSQHLSNDSFLHILSNAGAATSRYLQIIAKGSQAADHPILPAMPETAYLKMYLMKAANL